MVPVMMKPTGKQFNFLSPNILIQILLNDLHISSEHKLREFDKTSKYFLLWDHLINSLYLFLSFIEILRRKLMFHFNSWDLQG